MVGSAGGPAGGGHRSPVGEGRGSCCWSATTSILILRAGASSGTCSISEVFALASAVDSCQNECGGGNDADALRADGDSLQRPPAAEQGVAAFGGCTQRGDQLVVAAVVEVQRALG